MKVYRILTTLMLAGFALFCMGKPKQASMTERRALLTEREREIVAGEADVSDSYRYQTISRVRRRFDQLEDDLEALAAHGDLLDELRAIVCAPDSGDGADTDVNDSSESGTCTDTESE